MLKLALKVLLALTVVLAGGLWAAISTDHWPFDDSAQPAQTVWKANREIGRWLTDHAEPPMAGCYVPEVVPVPEPLNADELAKVQQTLKAMPTHDKINLPKAKLIKPGALAGGGCGSSSRG